MKKTGNIRSFLCGVLACALLLGVVIPAVASTTVEKKLTYNGITIRLNGKVIIPKDANGNTVDPFIIDGITYLPVRAVGEALGLNVSYDGKTHTVILGNDPELGQPAAWLGEMEAFVGGAVERKIEKDGLYGGSSTANNGDTFDRYYQTTSVTYLLRGEYTRLTGTFYLTKDYKNVSCGYRVLVYLDDKLAYTSPMMKSGVEPVPISVDVSEAYKMEIVMQNTKYPDSSEIAWSDGAGWYSGAPQIGNAALWTD